MRGINLTKINATRHSSYSDTDEPGESQEVQTTPVVINADAVRCFYTRRENKPGTRITFLDGGGFSVTESFDTVKAAIAPALLN